MKTLTTEQYSFLKQHLEPYQDPYDVIFDASGMGPSIYGPIMKSLDKFIAIGVTPCKEAGHTMRCGRKCIQCNSHCFHYRRKYYQNGYVYVAKSQSTGLYKIGCTDDLQDRENHLNNNYYGGLRDRKMLYHIYTKGAGEIEHKIHKLLQSYKFEKSYVHYGRPIDCKELFGCDYEIIQQAFDIVKD